MSHLHARANEAVQVNPPTGLDFHITRRGSSFLFAIFSLFALASIFTMLSSYDKPVTERMFYHTTTFALVVMSILYFTMASDLGWTGIQAEFNHVTTFNQFITPGIRQIFYARYVAWFLAFPLFYLNFATAVAVSWSSTLFVIGCQSVFVISLLIGSLIRSSYKWGYFAFALTAFFLIAFHLLFPFRRASVQIGVSPTGSIIFTSAILLLSLYLVCWGLSEGGNVIQPNSEAVFYAILDVCFFLVLGLSFIAAVRSLDFKERGIICFGTPVFHTRNLNASTTVGPLPVAPIVAATSTGAATGSTAAKEAALHDNHTHHNRHSGATAFDSHNNGDPVMSPYNNTDRAVNEESSVEGKMGGHHETV